MKEELKNILIETLDKKHIGYKVMRYENGKIISGANKVLDFNAKIGEIIKMPGNGIYMSPNKEYVLDYYSGLADEEILITFEFLEGDINWGNLVDKHAEVAVSKAKILDLEKI